MSLQPEIRGGAASWLAKPGPQVRFALELVLPVPQVSSGLTRRGKKLVCTTPNPCVANGPK